MACCGTAADFPLLILDTLPYVYLGAVGILLGFFALFTEQPALLPHLQNRKWPTISQKRGQRPLFVQCIEGMRRTNPTGLPWCSKYNQSLVAGPSRTTHLIFVWKSLQPIQSAMACSYPLLPPCKLLCSLARSPVYLGVTGFRCCLDQTCLITFIPSTACVLFC